MTESANAIEALPKVRPRQWWIDSGLVFLALVVLAAIFSRQLVFLRPSTTLLLFIKYAFWMSLVLSGSTCLISIARIKCETLLNRIFKAINISILGIIMIVVGLFSGLKANDYFNQIFRCSLPRLAMATYCGYPFNIIPR